MTRLRLVSLSLVIVGLVACAPQVDTDNSGLAAATQAWESAFNAGDVDAVAALYTENARLLPPNSGMEQGSAAVKAAFGEMVSAGLQIRLENAEVTVSGDLGQKIGRFTLLAPDGSTVDSGKFVDLWRKLDGEWRITADIWNSDHPAIHEGTLLSITHEVEDADRWLAAWSGPNSRQGMFAEHGAPQVSVLRNPEKPNQMGLVVHVTDMEAFEAYLSSPEGKAAKAEDGVKDSTMRFFMEVK